ncbi:MAG: hypothetical protein ACQEXI_13195 [Pseudomonadota bacterium]
MIAELEREEAQLEKEVSGIAGVYLTPYRRKKGRPRPASPQDDHVDSLIRRFRAAAERVRRVRQQVTVLRGHMRRFDATEAFTSQGFERIESAQETFRDMQREYRALVSSPMASRLMRNRRVVIEHEILMLELEIVFGELESLRWYMEEHNVDVGPVNEGSVPVSTGEQIDAIFDRL